MIRGLILQRFSWLVICPIMSYIYRYIYIYIQTYIYVYIYIWYTYIYTLYPHWTSPVKIGTSPSAKFPGSSPLAALPRPPLPRRTRRRRRTRRAGRRPRPWRRTWRRSWGPWNREMMGFCWSKAMEKPPRVGMGRGWSYSLSGNYHHI